MAKETPVILKRKNRMIKDKITDWKAFAEKDRIYTKKTHGYKGKERKKRAECLKIIATKVPGNLVYIDESGIDSIEDYSYGAKEGKGFML